MIVNLIVIILLCLWAWAYVRWSRVRRYWADRNVPFIPPNPLLGNLTFLLKQNPSLWFESYYNKFKSPYVGIWLFWRPGLIVNSFELAQKIMVNDSDIFRDRFLGSVNKDPFRDNIFLAKDPIWTSFRRRLTAVFTSAKLRALQHLTSTKSHEVVHRINNNIDGKNKIDLKSLFLDYTTDVISMTSLGVKSDAVLTGKGTMRDIATDMSTFTYLRGISWFSVFFIPEIADFFSFKFFSTEVINTLRKIFKSLVAQRNGYEGEKTQIRDFLDALVNIKKEALREGEDVDEDILVAQAAILLFGGIETSAMTLTYCVYELAFAPFHMQEKIYKEIIQARESVGSNKIDDSTLAGLTYLNCAIEETLRKYPGMAWIDRKTSKEYKIDDNLTIPAGTPVYVNSYGMHYDPKYYPEPEKFLPERFLAENVTNNRPFLSFGDGPRHCIGKRLAMQSFRYAIATLILNFEFRPLPNSPKPSECVYEKKHLFIQPGQILSIDFIRRNASGIVQL